jgi:cytochrome P450
MASQQLDRERFDPERFRPEHEQRLPRYAYLPFGAGHRICIGNNFALMEGQLLLATIAQRLRFALATPAPLRPTVPLTLRPIRPVAVTVTRRRGPAR